MEQFIKERQFHHAFQPIYDTQKNRCIAYEGLLRTDHFSNPEEVFRLAGHKGLLYEMDVASIEEAVRVFSTKQSDQNHILFLNLLPSTLADPRFLSFLHALFQSTSLFPSSVVFELSEQEDLTILFDHFDRIETIKSWGCRFALDDVGKGYANFYTMIEFDFDIIKLDQAFADNLAHSIRKKAFVKSMADYCKNLQIGLVLEGIETKIDYDTARSLHIHSAQGYYLGRPSELS